MKKALQHQSWISRTRQRAVNAALALAVLIVPTVVATQSVQPQSFSVLYSFTPFDGEGPKSSLVLDKEGNLYGTAGFGGGSIGWGEVFKLDRAGTETVLHSFGGSDGIDPSGGLVRDKEGNLYGTTSHGGTGGGTVFHLDTTNTVTVLHTFTGPDGAFPLAGLVRDKEGNLYGTTLYGGDLLNCLGLGCGVVFKVDTTGTETVLHSFIGPDGRGPAAGLVLDKEGNLYGTTFAGGTSNQGTVFKLDTKGTETVLHSFTGTDGGDPEATLVLDKAGNLYGTTDSGTSGDGTVFKLSLEAPHRER